MIINLKAEPARTQPSAQTSVDSDPIPKPLSFGALKATPREAGPSPTEEVAQNQARYPSELTLAPAYIDDLPAKRIKGTVASIKRDDLDFAFLREAQGSNGTHSDEFKILEASFRHLPLEIMPRAA